MSSTGIKWTDEYDKLLTIAVKSAPPSRWDLVRNYTGTVEWAKEVSTSKDDTNVVGNGASKKKSTATSSPQKSPGLDSPNLASSAALAGTFREKKEEGGRGGGAPGTRRIGSPQTQLCSPITNVDYTPPDSPAKTPPTTCSKMTAASDKEKKATGTMATNLAVFTPQDLEQRWRFICPPVKGSWIREEDVQLRACVKEFGEERWAHIAKHIPGRRGKQCRERWKNHLDPNLNKSSWTPAEDMALLSAHRCLGNKWSEISKLLNTGRGENSVKNRFHSLRLGAKRSLRSSSGSTQGNAKRKLTSHHHRP